MNKQLADYIRGELAYIGKCILDVDLENESALMALGSVGRMAERLALIEAALTVIVRSGQ